MKKHSLQLMALALAGAIFLFGALANQSRGIAATGSRLEPIRGLFVTAFGSPNVFSSHQEIRKLIAFAKKARIKILFVQVYKANQAWFQSDVGDQAPYKAAFKALGRDPFTLLIQESHWAGIEVHAWINLLSLGSNQNAVLLKKYGPSVLTRNLQQKKILEDYKIDAQYFLEPGDPRVRGELSRLVEEIVRAYPALDGLQFDYIRYPDSNPHYGYTDINVERFRKATGLTRIDDDSKAWQDWKRAQVTELLKQLIQKARKVHPRIRISTTGCMPYMRALHEAFQDWPMWANEGIADFVTVMDYSADPQAYKRWITQIKTYVKDFSKINIAFGAYKPETSLQVFQQELDVCETSGAGACVVFYYNSLLQKAGLSQFMMGDKKKGVAVEQKTMGFTVGHPVF